ncbi:MAG: PAS domain-containing sensor histidine kinase [Rhizobacter sp.]
MRYDAWAHGRMRWLVVGPLLVAVALLSALALASVDLLSAVRAYVGGESQWSKGQQDAIYHLERYITSRDPLDHERFQTALAIPLGDRRARLALEQDPPDLVQARIGLLAGGNHADDVDAMSTLFVRFRRVGFMAAAIDIWAEADTHIERLALLGRRVHERVNAGDTRSLRELGAELPALNERLTDLGSRFSTTLGEASRIVHRLVLTVTLVLASGLMLGAAWATWALVREQARVEQNLRDSNERWSLAADAAGLGLFDWDLRTGEASLDARGAALYGLPPQPASMKAVELNESRIHPDDMNRFRTAMTQAIAGPGATTVRYRVMLRDGGLRHLEVIARAGTTDAQVGTRMVGTLRDVTAEVHAAQLRLDKETADRTSRAKNEFFSRVSHELRTPLNAVLGFSELMHSDTLHPLADQQQKRVQQVIDSGRHLLGLIDNILHLSDLDDAGTPVPLVPVALLPLLTEAVNQLQPLAAQRQVRVTTQPAPHAIWVLAEPRRLAQVLHHLLANAIHYNRQGGEVNLRWERRGDEVCLDVRDTGPGLRPDQVAQLFQPFNRLGAEFSKVHGAGLGLVIVAQLLKRLNGRIDVSSTEGEGTCMQVHLPAADEGHAAVAASSR